MRPQLEMSLTREKLHNVVEASRKQSCTSWLSKCPLHLPSALPMKTAVIGHTKTLQTVWRTSTDVNGSENAQRRCGNYSETWPSLKQFENWPINTTYDNKMGKYAKLQVIVEKRSTTQYIKSNLHLNCRAQEPRFVGQDCRECWTWSKQS